jgi:hypothetical protein
MTVCSLVYEEGTASNFMVEEEAERASRKHGVVSLKMVLFF